MTPRQSGCAKPEILAPVGDADMLRAAVFAGADAVYLGLARFNARRTAGNFTPEALRDAAAFCRARGVRVYVTLNTTLYPGELPALAEAVRAAADAGADALIVQDLAVAALAREIAPGLALHGSTQMSVQSVDGARQLAAMGFSRVILARELAREEIARIAAEGGLEAEVFVHGALCMSVSGQCYMSAFLGGRSGNRGACAGPCRLPFDADERAKTAEGRHLSLKDLSLIGRLPELAEAGVASVKIEGRLRTPEYVAAAVDACLHARAGEAYDAKLLQDVFSRSGLTDGYLTGRRDTAMFGTRTEEDAAAARQAAPRLRELYRRERPRVGVSLALSLRADGAALDARDDDGNTVRAECGGTLPPGQKPLAEAEAAYRRALEKTGGTPFFVREAAVRGAGRYLPGGVVNGLRREALERLLALRERPAARAARAPEACARQAGSPARSQEGSPPAQGMAAVPGRPSAPDAAPPEEAAGERPLQNVLSHREFADGISRERRNAPRAPGLGYAARFAHAAQLPADALADAAALAVPLAEWRDVPPQLRGKTWLEAPRALFGGAEDAAARQAAESRGAGFAGYVAENIAQFTTLAGLPLAGGFGLNVTNPLAARQYAALGARALTLSPELALPDLAAIAADAPVPALALAYGHLPLMLARACPLRNVRSCAACGGAGALLDRKGMRFPVRCTGPDGARTVFNPIPLYWGDRRDALPGVLPLLYFTIEAPGRVREVLALWRARAPFDGAFTRGLYPKGTDGREPG